MDMQDLRLAIIPITVGLVEILKMQGLDTKHAPVASVLIATALNIAISAAITSMSVESVIEGIVFGLSASGLYSGGKTLKE